MASIVPAIERHCVPVWQIWLCLRAASTMRRPSLTLWLTGFSTYTSLPACMAQMAASACQWLGVAMVTMSTDLSSNTRRMSCTNLGARPCFLAISSTRCLPTFLVDVADVSDLGVLARRISAQVAAALAVDADHGHAQLLVGALALRRVVGQGASQRAGSHGRGGGEHRIFQESDAVRRATWQGLLDAGAG